MRPIVDNKLFIENKKAQQYIGMNITENVLRYLTILSLCADKNVCDVGCKNGVGSLILLEWAKRNSNNYLPVKGEHCYLFSTCF